MKDYNLLNKNNISKYKRKKISLRNVTCNEASTTQEQGEPRIFHNLNYSSIANNKQIKIEVAL